MSGHTSGPWNLSKTKPFEDSNFAVVVAEGDLQGFAIADVYLVPDGEANAYLIAASPELLEAAKAWEAWEAKLILEAKANALEFMSTELYDEMLALQDRRNEAIAKAGGRE